MEGLAFSAASTFSVNRSLLNLLSPLQLSPSRRRRRTRGLRVFACNGEPNVKLDQRDQMEIKFGRLLGEDPKLTLAKIMGRKLNPDVSYLEIEKSFYQKKGKKLQYSYIKDLPFDVDSFKKRQSSSSQNGLNLVRPVPKRGVQFESGDKSNSTEIKKPSQSDGKEINNCKGAMPNVILRKPSMFLADNVEMEKSSRLKIEPNLSLQMGKKPSKEMFSDIMLLKKPEPRSNSVNLNSEQASKGGKVEAGDNDRAETEKATKSKPFEVGDGSTLQEPKVEGNSILGLQPQPLQRSSVECAEEMAVPSKPVTAILVDSDTKFPTEAPLQGKPKRVDQSIKQTSNPSSMKMVFENPESYTDAVDSENFLATSTFKEHEDIDWARAEDLAMNEGKEEVDLISCSTRGFVASFGSLIGFLPYRNLAPRLKFLAFETWLRKKGLDPSLYKHSLGVIGNYEVSNTNSMRGSNLDPEINQKSGKVISPNMKLEDLLSIYVQEKIKFLSSFVGQRIKASVALTDRKYRKLIFSMRPREKEELVEKKRSLMAKLSVGDVVKCSIKKVTYFGIFVEIEGVPALIHQTEISWDATLNPASYFKIGQIVEAKVHQLDFAVERIFLSLKEITPDPLIEALECVVGDRNCLDGGLETAEADAEWADVESLVKELQKIEGIKSVSKGRFFFSPGLAPTFQVYMASMLENQYKLLARFGNKVQEVIVEASFEKEEMKSAILACTNRVE